MSNEMNEFLDEVDKLCFKYGYEIIPTSYSVNLNERIKKEHENHTLTIFGNGESERILYIDGDGRGK